MSKSLSMVRDNFKNSPVLCKTEGKKPVHPNWGLSSYWRQT